MNIASNLNGNMLYGNEPKNQQEMYERSMLQAQQQAKEFNARHQVPVTLVEHMTDPRAAQLQMLYATLDESGRRAAVALLIALVKLQKEK